MKLRIIYTAFVMSLGAFLLFGNAGGRAGSQGQGNTGAPGDETLGNGNPRTCQSCHNSGSFQPSLDLAITNANGDAIASNYTPDETYDVKFTVNSTPAAEAYGFQIVALAAPDGVDGNSIDSWTTTANNVQIATATNGRQYAEHDGASNSNEFVMKWTAPASGTGDVTFYFCGNAVNLASGTGGDNAICSSLSLADGTATSVNSPNAKVDLNIFPNPVGDVMHLKTTTQTSAIYNLSIYDQTGRMVMMQDIDLTVGEKVNFIEVSDLAAGFYNLILDDGNGEAISKKIIKK